MIYTSRLQTIFRRVFLILIMTLMAVLLMPAARVHAASDFIVEDYDIRMV